MVIIIKLKQINSKIKQLLLKHIEDFLIFGGLILINIPFYFINNLLGVGVTGLILFLLGIFFVKVR